MVLALDAVVDLPAEIELSYRRRLIGQAMPPKRLFADLANADPLHARRRAGKVPADEFMIQSDGLEDLRAAVGLHCRDAHLREDLEQPLIDRLDELAFRGLRVQPLREVALALHVHDRLEDEVRIHGPGSIADQAGEVMHIARLAGFHDEADFGPRAVAHQVMVDGRDAKEAWNRRPFFVDTAIAQDQKLVAFFNRLGCLSTEIVDCCPEPLRPLGHPEEHLERLALKMRIGDLADLLEIGIRQNRLFDPDAAAGLRMLIHQIRLGPDAGRQRHDQFFADRIDRRIGHLGEQLLEILEEQLRPIGQHRQAAYPCPSKRSLPAPPPPWA